MTSWGGGRKWVWGRYTGNKYKLGGGDYHCSWYQRIFTLFRQFTSIILHLFHNYFFNLKSKMHP